MSGATLEWLILDIIASVIILTISLIVIYQLFLNKEYRDKILLFTKFTTALCLISTFTSYIFLVIHDYEQLSKHGIDFNFIGLPHALMLLSNTFWLTSKLSLYSIFIGRIYYTFKDSKYSPSYNLLIVYVIVVLIISLLILVYIALDALYYQSLNTIGEGDSSLVNGDYNFTLAMQIVGLTICILDAIISVLIVAYFVKKLYQIVFIRANNAFIESNKAGLLQNEQTRKKNKPPPHPKTIANKENNSINNDTSLLCKDSENKSESGQQESKNDHDHNHNDNDNEDLSSLISSIDNTISTRNKKDGKNGGGGGSGSDDDDMEIDSIEFDFDFRQQILVYTMTRQTLLSSIAITTQQIVFILLVFSYANLENYTEDTVIYELVGVFQPLGSIITSFCVLLSFYFSQNMYDFMCRFGHKLCKLSLHNLVEKNIMQQAKKRKLRQKRAKLIAKAKAKIRQQFEKAKRGNKHNSNQKLYTIHDYDSDDGSDDERELSNCEEWNNPAIDALDAMDVIDIDDDDNDDDKAKHYKSNKSRIGSGDDDNEKQLINRVGNVISNDRL